VRGFTLIELLAGMAVLSILIVLLAQFVNIGSNAWEQGMRQSESSTSARAGLDYLAAELSTAVANKHVTFRQVDRAVQTYHSALNDYSDRLMFVSVSRTPDENNPARAGIEVAYFLRQMKDTAGDPMPDRYELVRSFRASTNSQYRAYQYDSGVDWTDSNWSPSGQTHTIAENVSSFQVWVYPDTNLSATPNYQSGGNSDKLPVWADIYLETLGEGDAMRAALISNSSAREEFVRKWSRGFTTRVHFRNRSGYNLGS
jgi:prepilin-type N-terminal cleavage/methylation domain-containing protein